MTLMVTQAALLGCAGDVLGKVQLRASCSLPHGMCRAALAFFLNICLPGWLWKKGKQWELQLPWPGFVASPLVGREHLSDPLPPLPPQHGVLLPFPPPAIKGPVVSLNSFLHEFPLILCSMWLPCWEGSVGTW